MARHQQSSDVASLGGSMRTRLAMVIALVLVAWGILGSGTALSSDLKTYTASIGPGTAEAGSHRFVATLHNTSTQHAMGSANITPPSPLMITATSQPVVNETETGTASVRHNVLELRQLGLAPGATATVSFTAEAACDADGGVWAVAAKQANNFNGPPGNDFALDESGSELALDVSGCVQAAALQFLAHPADAEKNTPISSVAADPDGAAIEVAVVDSEGDTVTTSSASITVALGSSPAGATLSGTTMVAAVDGVATFDDLEIDLPQHGYTLVATSDDLDSPPSNAFTIWNEAVLCEGGAACSGQVEASDRLMQSQMDAASPAAGDPSGALFMSLGVDTVDTVACGGDTFNHAPQVLTVDSSGLDGQKTVTISIDKLFDQRQANNGVSFYEVCFSGDAPFINSEGKQVPAGGSGILPHCGSVTPIPAPCLNSKTKSQGGDVELVVTLPEGDPRMW